MKNYKLRDWDNYDRQTKGELYLILAHFMRHPEGFVFADIFKDSYIKYLENFLGMSVDENQYKGYLGSLCKMSYFEHENRDFGQHPDNRVYLNITGIEFFFLFKNKILSYGKENNLDLYLHHLIRKYIPDFYLNTTEPNLISNH